MPATEGSRFIKLCTACFSQALGWSFRGREDTGVFPFKKAAPTFPVPALADHLCLRDGTSVSMAMGKPWDKKY